MYVGSWVTFFQKPLWIQSCSYHLFKLWLWSAALNLVASWPRELFIKRSACSSQPVRSCVRGFTWPTSWPSGVVAFICWLIQSFFKLQLFMFEVPEVSWTFPRLTKVMNCSDYRITNYLWWNWGKMKNQRSKNSLFFCFKVKVTSCHVLFRSCKAAQINISEWSPLPTVCYGPSQEMERVSEAHKDLI